jgi:hypothetical protein
VLQGTRTENDEQLLQSWFDSLNSPHATSRRPPDGAAPIGPKLRMSFAASNLGDTVRAMRPMVPAKGYEISKRFYLDLEFHPSKRTGVWWPRRDRSVRRAVEICASAAVLIARAAVGSAQFSSRRAGSGMKSVDRRSRSISPAHARTYNLAISAMRLLSPNSLG